MKISIKIFFAFVIIFWNTILKGQQKDSILNFRNSISVNIGLLLFREINISYERILPNKQSISGTFGIKPYPNVGPLTPTPTDSTDSDLLAYFWSNSIYVAFSYRKYFYFEKVNLNPYIEFIPFYRHNFYDKQMIVFDDYGHDYWRRLQSSVQKIIGAKFIIGAKPFPQKKNIGSAIDLYTGIGLREKFVSTTIYNSYRWGFNSNSYSPPLKVNNSYLLPTIHFGLKLALVWQNKHKTI